MPVQGGVRLAAYLSMPGIIRYIKPERAAVSLGVPILPLLFNEALLALGNRVSLHPLNTKRERDASMLDGCVGGSCFFSRGGGWDAMEEVGGVGKRVTHLLLNGLSCWFFLLVIYLLRTCMSSLMGLGRSGGGGDSVVVETRR